VRRILDTSRWLLAACLALGLALPAWGAKTPDEIPDGGTANAAPPAARISYLDGTLYCWGPFDDEKRHLMLNDIVREGDELYAAPGTFAEIEFPGASYLRLDGGSSVVVQHYRDDLQLIPTAGAYYVSTGDWSRGAVRFGPDGIEVASESLVRMDISPDEYRRVGVAHGLARLDGEDFSLELVDNDQAWAERFDARWEMGRFAPRDGDDFDLWSLDREVELRRPLDEDTPSYPLVGYSELEDQGTWVVADGVWVWRPYVEAGWRPFSHGEWVWVTGYGWTWVSGHRWGYVTSHHGRWVYDSFYGWVWMPGMTWAPAWVTWSVHGSNVGWCPIDWWGYPVVITVGWYSYWDYRCWTFCHHDYFYHGGYHHHGAYHWHHYHGHGSHHGHHGSGHGSHGSGHGSHGHGHGNSHHRHSSDHGSHQASSSHARDDGAAASRPRDTASNSRARAFGSDFRSFDKDEFDAARPVAVRDANSELLRRGNLNESQRQAYERGGESRTSLITQRFPADRGGSAGDRSTRGSASRGTAASTTRGESAKGSAAQGIRGESSSAASVGDRPSRASGETVGRTRTDLGEERPVRGTAADVVRGSTYRPSERSTSSSSTGNRETYTPIERSTSSSSSTPYVPRYNGRSDGQKGYSGSSSSSSSGSRSSVTPSRSSSGSRSSTSSNSSTTRSRSSTSSSSTRSRSSSSGSKSKSSSSGSRSSSRSSSGGSKKSSGSKKRK